MFVVDTNIFVYAAHERSPFHATCLEQLDLWRRQADAWFTTWAILYEFLRVTTHPRVLGKPFTVPQAWTFVSSLLESPGFGLLVPTDRHATIATRTFEELPHLAGNLAHDAHTAILMREHGISRIYTRDMDFHRFPFVECIDPVAGSAREPRSAYRVKARRGRAGTGRGKIAGRVR